MPNKIDKQEPLFEKALLNFDQIPFRIKAGGLREALTIMKNVGNAMEILIFSRISEFLYALKVLCWF